jgi:hypothetical protein
VQPPRGDCYPDVNLIRLISKSFYSHRPHLIENKVDIVVGDKGAGKTTIYRYLQKQYTTIPQLSKVELVAGFNPAGNPIFQRLIQPKPYSEGQYLYFWKAYILSLAGNWLLKLCDGSYNTNTRKLDKLLFGSGLRSKDDSVETIFSRLSNLFHRLMNPKSAGVQFSLNESGMPVLTPQVEFAKSDAEEKKNEDDIIDHDQALACIPSAMARDFRNQ